MTESTAKIHNDGDVQKEEGELIFDPFNPQNREITKKEVQTILETYGVPGKVHNFNLYKRAFIHRSYIKRPFQENEKNGIEGVICGRAIYEGKIDLIEANKCLE